MLLGLKIRKSKCGAYAIIWWTSIWRLYRRYKFCIKKGETVLVIGYNIRTDIKGANNMNLDSLFITHGIHKKDFLNLPLQNYDKILEKYETKTNYYQERLSC